MGFKTQSAFTTSQVNSKGLIEFGTGDYKNPPKEVWNGMFSDGYTPLQYSLISGVLAGGVCTAALLSVTVPNGTAFLAGGKYWETDADVPVTVPNNATTYIWGCQDGQLRTGSSLTVPPTGYDNNRSCLICKVLSASGTATVDNTVQQSARTVDIIGRFVSEKVAGWQPVADAIAGTSVAILPQFSQLSIFDKLTIKGKVTIQGKLRIQ